MAGIRVPAASMAKGVRKQATVLVANVKTECAHLVSTVFAMGTSLARTAEGSVLPTVFLARARLGLLGATRIATASVAGVDVLTAERTVDL